MSILRLKTRWLPVWNNWERDLLEQKGEVYVPLFIWQHTEFQEWYAALKEAGNRLDHVSVVGHNKSGKHLFAYQLHVNVWVEKEQRHKSNETVFFRRNVSNILAYYQDQVVLVREFRSPVNNKEGFVYELPGGSQWSAEESHINAQQELAEETGIYISDTNRFKLVSVRQMVATFSPYTSSLYKVELTKEEFLAIPEKAGMAEDGEITYVIKVPVKDILQYPVDYSTLGMVMSCFNHS